MAPWMARVAVAARRFQGKERYARTPISGIQRAMAQGRRPESRAVTSGDNNRITHSTGIPDQ